MEGGEVKSPEEWRQARSQLLTAFPDLRMTIEQSVAEGDTVVLRWRAQGTHGGDAMGLKRSGRKFEAVGSTWMKFADGQLVWGYDTWNQGALTASLAAQIAGWLRARGVSVCEPQRCWRKGQDEIPLSPKLVLASRDR